MDLNESNWELINDDGFIYKRLKHQTLTPTSLPAPPPDQAAQQKTRTERKKTILSKLKTMYQQEICHWELLSNTLQALQHRARIDPLPALSPDIPGSLSVEHSYREMADTILVQVEGQEVFIKEVSRLCEVAESFCNGEEEMMKRAFVCLPIWEPSPRKLIAKLCEE